MSLIKRPIRTEGDIAFVTLTKGYEAIIDANDVDLVGQHNWCVRGGRNTLYATRGEGSKGNQRFIRLHRFLTDAPKDLIVDHINGNGLDNRRCNLRLVSNSENTRNQTIKNNNTSGYKGVSLYKATGRWCAKICVEGKQYFLGYFDTPEEASIAYQNASKIFHKEFGRI